MTRPLTSPSCCASRSGALGFSLDPKPSLIELNVNENRRIGLDVYCEIHEKAAAYVTPGPPPADAPLIDGGRSRSISCESRWASTVRRAGYRAAAR
jgi:hypothetical protein